VSIARSCGNTTNVPYVNPTGYCNPELDAIAAKAAAVPLEERGSGYKKYEESSLATCRI